MRLLFDESVTKRLRLYLPSHHVRTVVEMGWSGTKNGKLLTLAASDFDALITVDKNMQYQQNLQTLLVGIVVLSAASNELVALVALMPNLEIELLRMAPGTVITVGQ